MCTLVILRRPEHMWPVIIGANRDEMLGRPAASPARHWPDRPEVIAGLDQLAGGSWLGVNDWGVAAAILNRHGSLGPAPGQRSRGELVQRSITRRGCRGRGAQSRPRRHRTFNLIIADNRARSGCATPGGIDVGQLPKAIADRSAAPAAPTIGAWRCYTLSRPARPPRLGRGGCCRQRSPPGEAPGRAPPPCRTATARYRAR